MAKHKRRKKRMTLKKLAKMPRRKAMAYLNKIGW